MFGFSDPSFPVVPDVAHRAMIGSCGRCTLSGTRARPLHIGGRQFLPGPRGIGRLPPSACNRSRGPLSLCICHRFAHTHTRSFPFPHCYRAADPLRLLWFFLQTCEPPSVSDHTHRPLLCRTRRTRRRHGRRSRGRRYLHVRCPLRRHSPCSIFLSRRQCDLLESEGTAHGLHRPDDMAVRALDKVLCS
jgi:hypothetical protein